MSCARRNRDDQFHMWICGMDCELDLARCIKDYLSTSVGEAFYIARTLRTGLPPTEMFMSLPKQADKEERKK
jgi:hypothetical protein